MRVFFSIICLLCIKLSGQSPVDSADALKALMEGNGRFMNGIPQAKQDFEKREKTQEGQSPFAVIVGCSDSRVSPEIVFDQSLGDLFVVRVAGNVVGEIEVESIEFAVTQLQTPLILVLGHQNCGAVNAVLHEKVMQDDLAAIAPLIVPAIEKARKMPGDLLTNAIRENVRLIVKKLIENPVLSPYVQGGKLKIKGGYYELTTGRVEILKEHP